jgi:4-hydroxythreonine-4-phosphate dehydrogenase
MHPDKPTIGISIGDVNGIGLEVILKTFSDTRVLDMCTPIIFAHQKIINFYKKSLDLGSLHFNAIHSFQQIRPKQVNVLNIWDKEIDIKPGSLTPEAGALAVASLTQAAQALKDNHIQGIVTAPIHKSNVQSNSFKHTGHTPFLKEFFGAKEVVMMLYSSSFRVALLSEHIPIAKAAAAVTAENIIQKLSILHRSLIRDFGISKPKIAILGLNPHAGDGGLIGDEEQKIIKPTIEKLKQEKGWLLFGPYSADGFFAHNHHTQFDAVLAMYHDQGLIPLKSLGAEEGVNYTCGLPYVRTSPDHGTAFDIAGKNIADEQSFRNALFEAIDIIKRQNNFDEYTANPLKRHKLSKE